MTLDPLPSITPAPAVNMAPEFQSLPASEDRSLASDGYHTFAELYEHRHALTLALARALPHQSWFSLRHHDGEPCFSDGKWFIFGIDLPDGGHITYHLPMRMWELAKMTGAAELERGFLWDGHTAADVVLRLKRWASLATPAQPEPRKPGNNAANALEAVGVFKNAEGLEQLLNADTFWEQQPFGTRLYFGDGATDYLHRNVLSAAVALLNRIPDRKLKELTDEQLYKMANVNLWGDIDEAVKLARDAIAADRSLNGGYAPQLLAEKEVSTVVPWLYEAAVQAADSGSSHAAGMLTLAAQLLDERVNEEVTSTAIPVSVESRLPEPKHFDTDRRCWYYMVNNGEGCWRKMARSCTLKQCKLAGATHWLDGNVSFLPAWNT